MIGIMAKKIVVELDLTYPRKVSADMRMNPAYLTARNGLTRIVEIQITRFIDAPDGKGIRSQIQLEVGAVARMLRELMVYGGTPIDAINNALKPAISSQNEEGVIETLSRLDRLIEIRHNRGG